MNRQQTIWKFPLDPFGTPYIDLPEDAEILSCGVQRPYADQEQAVIWVRLDPEAPTKPRYVAVFGTGHTVPPEAKRFVGTFHIEGGYFFHVFEGEK